MEKVNIKYVITHCVVEVEDVRVCSYGIACVKDGQQIKCIEDISTDKTIVQNAKKAFNKYHLSPEHFEDAVEDVVTETLTY